MVKQHFTRVSRVKSTRDTRLVWPYHYSLRAMRNTSDHNTFLTAEICAFVDLYPFTVWLITIMQGEKDKERDDKQVFIWIYYLTDLIHSFIYTYNLPVL